MPGFEVKPFAPKSAAEKKLANPEHIEPVLFSKPPAKTVDTVLTRLENSLGLRFGCNVNEWNTPISISMDNIASIMIEAYNKRSLTVGELYVEVNELTIASARAIFTMPVNIPGYRKRAVVGTFNYFPTSIVNTDGISQLALARKTVGDIKTDAENPYFRPGGQTDPTRLRDGGSIPYLREGTIGTI